MNNCTIFVDDIDEAWLKWYKKLSNQGIGLSSRDGDVVGEILNAVTVISDPTRNVMKNNIRRLPMKYAIGEMLWYMSGNKNLSEIQKYTTAWNRMSDDGETVNSNYGWCIKYKFGFDQWEYVKDLLRNSPETRQAVIHIKTADCEESKDVNCTVCIQFFIRDGKLHATTYMRSNDIWMGFPYDVFQFTCMQILMSMELGVEIGTYTHIVGSLHLYKRDLVKDE
ncbi:MAG: thymidylate synthase [Lachnospiraceae bacterium]|nr:thymidylate synthase [Lachnospiraceae bacterium]